MAPQIKKRLPFLLLAGLAAAGLMAFGDLLTPEALARHRDALLALRQDAPLLLAAGFVAAYVLVVATSIPGATLLSLTGGFLFGLFPGLFLNMAGASLGALALFLAVRAGFAAEVAAAVARSPAGARLWQRLHAHEISALLAMRFLPAVPFFAANLLAALAGVRLWAFVLTTVIGILPGSIIITQIGAGLGEVFERGEMPDLSILTRPAIWAPLLGLALLSALPLLLGKKR